MFRKHVFPKYVAVSELFRQRLRQIIAKKILLYCCAKIRQHMLLGQLKGFSDGKLNAIKAGKDIWV